MIQAIIELLIDALRRRLVIELFFLSSLIIGGISYGLQLEVVDGAIASAKVFGQIVNQSEEGNLNLSGIMTGVRILWFSVITITCNVIKCKPYRHLAFSAHCRAEEYRSLSRRPGSTSLDKQNKYC